jgi:prepilin-type processing-associated H-X9-DG protein
MNSKLFGKDDNGVVRNAWKMSMLRPAGSVVLICEKLMAANEYKYPANASLKNCIDSRGYIDNIAQPKADWTRFAARHRGGGYILFADGHVAWWSWQDVQAVNIAQPNSPPVMSANQPVKGIIWNPLGPVGGLPSADN